MPRIKDVLERIFCLPPLATIVIAVPSFGAVILVLEMGIEGPAACAAYLLSAYALIITVTGIPKISRGISEAVRKSFLVNRLRDSSLGSKILGDVAFRMKLSLYQGLAVNMFYAGFKLVFGIIYQSVWFGTLSVYYILLALMRFLLLRHVNREDIGKNMVGELRRYRLCGIILLVMNQALAGVVILVVHRNSGFEYPGLLIYVMAMYTFYITITAIVNVIRFRRYGSPVMSAAKVINLTAAAVSVMSLETAMLAQFGGGDDPAFRRMMTGVTGAAVCFLVLAMAVFMIVQSTRQLKGVVDYGNQQ